MVKEVFARPRWAEGIGEAGTNRKCIWWGQGGLESEGYRGLQVAPEEMDLHMQLKEAHLSSGDRDQVGELGCLGGGRGRKEGKVKGELGDVGRGKESEEKEAEVEEFEQTRSKVYSRVQGFAT